MNKIERVMKTTEKLIMVLMLCMIFTVGYAQSDTNDGKETAGWSPAGIQTLQYDKKLKKDAVAEPKLISSQEDYDPMDYNTWPCFEMPAGTVKDGSSRGRKDDIILLCTKKATYLFEIHQMMWDKMYFHSSATSFIRDSRTGQKYYVKDHVGAPLDVCYWMQGKAGRLFYSVSIYPPLPKTCTVVDIGQDSHPETAPGTTGWARQETLMKIPVRELQANQRKIVLQK